MHEVVDPLGAAKSCFRLRNLIVMMRELQVNTARVDIERFAQ